MKLKKVTLSNAEDEKRIDKIRKQKKKEKKRK